jgi:chorismate synthase
LCQNFVAGGLTARKNANRSSGEAGGCRQGRSASMSHNTFGHLFRVTTWGESHGPALGCVVDGCPPGIRFTLAEIQADLDRRRPGQSRFVTQRREPDQVKILSGVLTEDDGETLVTTGTPISMMIENVDQRSKDYGEIARQYRPGHADYAYDVKYGVRDHRGGGRSSARETAARVAAGAWRGWSCPASSCAARWCDGRERHRPLQLGLGFCRRRRNPFFTPDPASVPVFDGLSRRHPQGRLVGRRHVEIVADGVPAGLGAPIYGKLDQDIAANLMSINAVKGVEIGEGFAAAR